MARVRYYGNDGLILKSAGRVRFDRKGLASGRVVFHMRPEDWAAVPQALAAHPFASFMLLEEVEVVFTPGFWSVLADYVGCQKDVTDPHYEFDPGIGTEPIETVDNFLTKVAGKPSGPLNEAIFRDEAGNLTDDDTKGTFDRFRTHKSDGTLNPWAGTEDYLTMASASWSKNWVQRSKPTVDSRPLKVVASPPGPHPEFGGAVDWLELPPAYSVRAGVYDCSQRWLPSGPRGWNKVVYNDEATP